MGQQIQYTVQYLFTQFIYRLNAIPNENPRRHFFLEINWLILKFIRKTKGPRIVKMISKKRSKVEGLILSDFKTSYDVIIIQKVLYWQKDRYTHIRTELKVQNYTHVSMVKFWQMCQGNSAEKE